MPDIEESRLDQDDDIQKRNYERRSIPNFNLEQDDDDIRDGTDIQCEVRQETDSNEFDQDLEIPEESDVQRGSDTDIQEETYEDLHQYVEIPEESDVLSESRLDQSVNLQPLGYVYSRQGVEIHHESSLEDLSLRDSTSYQNNDIRSVNHLHHDSISDRGDSHVDTSYTQADEIRLGSYFDSDSYSESVRDTLSAMEEGSSVIEGDDIRSGSETLDRSVIERNDNGNSGMGVNSLRVSLPLSLLEETILSSGDGTTAEIE
uniref:Uncharacterized protein n=1 Tax=Cacopsylla melanoneura TaxID=428564 RepID=A0A8D9DWI8_9HEMI